ncbi:MAG: P1 family peptidase [Hyphomicrobiaceae bacterium]|nr:P1 family peptidase [Hyphomicrobiaceae bacterium]MCC0023361.1 P1 family peptidase [Hyphomicrobiaceae bacterium]
MKPGQKNLITDVPGLLVGNASDKEIKSGTTVLFAEKPFVAGVSVMGGAPGTRETDLLAPDKSVERIDALVLSGGSAFGLDAASGVADALVARGRGFHAGSAIVPIVPAAILFDLVNGGDKDWGQNPYRELGRQALEAAGTDFELGSVGAGTGATTAGFKGGLGSASLELGDGIVVGALVAVNPGGHVVADDEGHFLAGALEMDGEFGGLGAPRSGFDLARLSRLKPDYFFEMMGRADAPELANTTIAIVATNVALTKAGTTRMATAAHDGFGRAIMPAHSPEDGDLIFALSTGEIDLDKSDRRRVTLGHMASLCLSRAVARAVYEASPAEGDLFPAWRQRFGCT